jgi:hypothetical protein
VNAAPNSSGSDFCVSDTNDVFGFSPKTGDVVPKGTLGLCPHAFKHSRFPPRWLHFKDSR